MKPRRISPGIGGPNHRVIGLRPILGSKCFQPAGLNVGPSGYDLMILDGRARSDTDAAAFISAASISDSTQQTAIYFLVTALKDTGLWTKMTACYPFVGGNATAHSKDLKGVYNIVNAANSTWTGMTHDSNGITGNGSTTYGDTGVNTFSLLGQNSQHISVYSRTNSASNSIIDIGAFSSGTLYTHIGIRDASATPLFTPSVNQQNFSVANIDSTGFYIATRTASASAKAYKRGRVVSSSSSASSGNVNLNLYLSGRNVTGSAAGFSNRNYSFFSIGSGLSDSDAQNLSMIVQSYQTILGRAV